MPDFQTGEPMDIAWRLLKYPVQTTLPQFAPNMGPPIMAVRGMSPDRARQAMAYGLKPSPKHPVNEEPVVWSVGGTGPHSQREASQYGRQLVGIRQGAFPAIPHDVGSEGTPIYAHPGDIAPSDLVMLMLKALPEQQMTHRGSQKRGTIHPSILGYLSRRDDDPDLEVGRGRLRPLHPRRDFTRPSSPGAYGLSHALEKPGWGWDTHTQVPTSGQDIRTLAPPSFSPQESIDIEHGWLPDHYKSKVFLEGEN